jgi:uncharacterized OB-fold protein
MLTGCELDQVGIGMPVELTVERLYTDEQGRDVMTYKYLPTAEGEPA